MEYSTIDQAIGRIDRALGALGGDMDEFLQTKIDLFMSMKGAVRQNKQLEELDGHMMRSRKVRDNMLVFRNLFAAVSVN